jgi:hypothetical protein
VVSWGHRSERYPQGKRLEVGLEYHEDGINEPVGKGNLDPWSLGPCARTHIPGAVSVPGSLGQIVAVVTRTGEVKARLVTAEEAARIEAQAAARPELYARVVAATVYRITDLPEPEKAP